MYYAWLAYQFPSKPFDTQALKLKPGNQGDLHASKEADAHQEDTKHEPWPS